MLRRTLITLSIALFTSTAYAQILRSSLPVRALGAQFAGSTGLYSFSAMRYTRTERIGVGLSYGRTPRSHGGPLNAWNLRFHYSPWKLDVGHRFTLEPLQTGVFVSYTTGLDLSSHWPSYLDKGYYWWTPNFRQHIFLRTQLGYRTQGKTVNRVAAYFEVNTNDLYLYSYFPNRKSLSPYDILFFGAGVQVYFAPFKERE